MVEAVAIPSSLPGVSAWISPVTVTPDGIAFSILANTTERGVRYYPTAQATINGEAVEIGGGNSPSTTMSMTQFWHALDPADLDSLRAIDIYEADGYDADRTHVHTFTVAR